MGKELINVWDHRVDIDSFLNMLEEFGVPCDKKKNGNIYAKSNEKSREDLRDFKNTVYALCKETGMDINKPDIDYMFFDHLGFFTADDGSSVFAFSPYCSEYHWPALIKPLWDKGFYVKMYHKKKCKAINHMVLVKPRKNTDTMFDSDSEFTTEF